MIEAVSGRLIGPKTWNRNVKILRARLDSPQTVWAPWVIIYTINYVVMCMRSEMATDFGFTKWNRCWVIGREQ